MCLDPGSLTALFSSGAGAGAAAVPAIAPGATFAMTPVATGISATTALQVGGIGLSALSSYSQGQYAKRVAQNTALQAEWAAEDATERGRTEELRHRLKVSQLKGEQRADAAARGLAVDEGSALDQLVDTAEFGELDALIIRNNYAREATGYGNQAANYRAEGSMAGRAGTMTAAGTLLSGGAKVADRWYRMSR